MVRQKSTMNSGKTIQRKETGLTGADGGKVVPRNLPSLEHERRLRSSLQWGGNSTTGEGWVLIESGRRYKGSVKEIQR